MKIGYFHYLSNYLYGKGAAYVHTQDFAEACRAIGHEIDIIRLGRPERGRESVPVRTKRYPVWLSRWLHEPRGLLENVSYFGESQWIRDKKPDGVLVRYAFGRASVAWAAQVHHRPWILQIDAPYELESSQLTYYWKMPLACPAIERYLVRACDAMVLVSREAYDYFLERGVSRYKMLFVPNGVDTERFRPDINGEDIRLRWGLQGRRVLGFVGGFYPWHGMDSLVNLMREIFPRFPEVSLLLVGEGPERKPLEAKIREEGFDGRVVFTGIVDPVDVPHYLAAMDIALAPAPRMERYYYSPMKIYEYLAAGKPIVAARIGQMEQMIQEGENGLLFPPGDWLGFSRQVERLLNDPELSQHLACEARRSVVGKYTWRGVAERVIRLMEQVIQGEPEPARGI